MNLQETIKHLTEIGSFLKDWLNEYQNKDYSNEENIFLYELINQQHYLNNWHTEQDIVEMLQHLSSVLTEEILQKWLTFYPEIKDQKSNPSPVLIKPYYNYSFSGIHEWLCCIITETPMVVQAGENQSQILKFLCKKITDYDIRFKGHFDINNNTSLKPERFIIHTEKYNNTVQNYFKHKKALIIEPRPSIAILSGHEKLDDLRKLGNDVFFNLGQSPRSLRKIYLPVNIDIKLLIEAFEPFANVYRNNKYANNYDYHQSVFLMNKIKFLDNGFLIFKEDHANEAPTGCLYYEYYNKLSELLNKHEFQNSIENIISTTDLPFKSIKPGLSNLFNPWDYLNRKDIVQFLLDN